MAKRTTKVDVDYTIDITVEVTTEITTDYIPGEDITIVWQLMSICGECLQRTLVGWYHGSPDERSTEQFSRLGVMAQYIFD